MIPDDQFELMYRPSATLIIAAKDSVKVDGFDYKILLAKRTAATAYAPDHHVFPGGVFDAKADDSLEWLNYFKEFGVTSGSWNELCLEHLPNRPRPLMTNGSNLSRDISLRITAIRETFEEVGLLLCLRRDELKTLKKGSVPYNGSFDRLNWQKKVHNNSLEFLKLCMDLDVLPDIWSLCEWSIWRSPATSAKRYDTVLYIVNLEQQPELLLEPSEVERALWVSPLFSLRLFKERKIWLPPMLFYEISRLTNVESWLNLFTFAQRRQFKGSTLLMMTYYRCDDALVGTLPSDDNYPTEPFDHTRTIQIEGTSFDFSAKATNLHRIIYYDMYNMLVVSNIAVKDHHLSPIARSIDAHNASNL